MIPSSPSTCPQCGAAIPTGAPQGVCPRCLMQQAMQPTVVLSDPPPAPPDADIIEAFPQFEILQLIGAGGMGRVYKVRQRHLDRVAALKILPRELAADPAFAERFTREGRALAKLSHPNIVGVFDFGISGAYYWLLMEYVDGVNLRQAMHAEAMKPAEALQIIPHICAALEFAHRQGVLHRDIKPENILIDTAGRVKIADFGVAKLNGEAGRHVSLTLSGSALGTPAYMAPEQIERPQDVDHRADIYSLGVVFYEMLTGGLPLGRFPAPSETAGIDPRLDTVVFRTLEKQRERRYQSAGEMKTQVENVARAQPPFIPPQIPRAPGRAPERTSRKAVWGLVLVLLGMLGLLVALPMAYMDLRREEAQLRAEQDHVEVERNRDARPASPAARAKPDLKPIKPAIEGIISIITGMVLGCYALRDIRLAGGTLGGAVAATFAAGLLPALVIVASCGAALAVLGQSLMAGRLHLAVLLLPGSGAGVWLSYLMMRGMHRAATGWTPATAAPPHARSMLATAAIVLTIAGAAIMLLVLIASASRPTRPQDIWELLTIVDLLCLLVGLICGVLSRHEPAGKVCAWISGSLFVVAVLLFS